MLESLTVLVLGVVAGAFTGMVPGVHPNTVTFALLPLYFSFEVDFLLFSVFLVSMAVSHSFHGFFPAIFLGMAEAESALASLPGAEMAANGKGLEAFRLTVVGGAVAITVIALLSPAIFKVLEHGFELLEPVMEYLLLFFLTFTVFIADSPYLGALTVLLSSALGHIAFSMPVNQSYVLVPIFSGLFAVPAVILLLTGKFEIPDQELGTSRGLIPRGGLSGVFAGLVAGAFPGVGAATSSTMLTPLMDSREQFLASMGAVNSSDIIVSFIALYAIDKARSGTAVAIDSLATVDFHMIVFLSGSAFLASAAAIPFSLSTAKILASRISDFNPWKLAVPVLLIIVLVSYFLAGLQGILILITSAAIGISARRSGSRACCMACLIFPAMMFYSSIGL